MCYTYIIHISISTFWPSMNFEKKIHKFWTFFHKDVTG